MQSSINPIVGALIDLALGLLRWSQMVPMLVVGGVLGVMLLVMTAVNFQGEMLAMANLAEPVVRWLDSLPFINISGWLESLAEEDGSIHLGGEDLKAAAAKIYFYCSLAFFAIAALANWLWGPFPRWRYGKKMKGVMLAAALISAGFFCNYFFGSEQFNGSFGSWALLFILFPLIWVIVSAYSLAVSHLLTKISDMIHNPGPANPTA